MEKSRFQFEDFKIVRSLIERENKKASENISFGFNPRGYINKNEGLFQLNLEVKIEDKNKAFNIEIVAVADYLFEKKESLDKLKPFFYVNAPAILFPYIRAYISTLTNLSGFAPINLPTLNITKLGKELEENTEFIEK